MGRKSYCIRYCVTSKLSWRQIIARIFRVSYCIHLCIAIIDFVQLRLSELFVDRVWRQFTMGAWASMRNPYGCVFFFFFLIWSSALTTVWADLYSKACSNTEKYPPDTKCCRYFYGLIKSRMAIYRSTTLTYVPILDFSPMHSFKFAS